MIFTTNAENLAELDIAIAELDAFQRNPYAERPTYETRRAVDAWLESEDEQRAMGRLAMFDYNISNIPTPTLWTKIRGHRYDKRFDHSTHNFWPFTGKLEPRLARACVNLAVGWKPEATICDPFCGSGTVILEANLMGLPTIGCDLDPFAVWLTEAKTTSYLRSFNHRFDELWPMEDNPPPIPLQRDACPPTNASVNIVESDAQSFLLNQSDLDAIVTSPPYYDAINYNQRHAELRTLLGLKTPTDVSLGSGQSTGEYQTEVESIAKAMAAAIRPGGRIVIVAAPYHSVDTPLIYEQALRSWGLTVKQRLPRPYSKPVLDVREDVVLVMEKADG